MKRSFIKILVIIVIIGLIWTGLSAVIGTMAYFNDTEISQGNSYSAGILDFSLRSGQSNFVSLETASNMKPGDSVTRDIYIKKEGNLPFKYTAHSEPISGFCDEDYYNTLKLKVWYNYYYDYEPYDPGYHKNRTMAQKYDGMLKDFNLPSDDSDLQIPNSHPYFNNIFYGTDEHWFYFQIILPVDAPNTFEGKTCQFKFVFDGWQTNLPDSSQGFTDTEEITNTIASVDWTPPVISNVESLIATPGENNELKAIIAWQTDELATSNVDWGIDVAYGNVAPITEDITVDNTSHSVEILGLVEDTIYHFRVRSKDAFGNEAISGDYTIETDGSRWGVGWSNIVINEFLPDPLGDDSASMPDGEWVELYNKDTNDVDVSGWFLADSSLQKVYISSSNTNTGGTIVPAKGFLVVYLNGQYADWLNNDTDIVSLFAGKWLWLIDLHAYDKSLGDIVLENKSFARIPDGSHSWYDPIPTPGAPNKLSEEEKMELGLLPLEEQIATTISTTIPDSIPDISTSTTTTTVPDPEATTTTESSIEEITTTTELPVDESTTTTTTTTTIPPIPASTTTTTTEPPMDEATTIEEVLIIEEASAEETPVIDEPAVIEETSVNETLVIEQTPATEEQPVIAPADNNSGEQAPPADNSSSGGDSDGGETVSAAPSDGVTE